MTDPAEGAEGLPLPSSVEMLRSGIALCGRQDRPAVLAVPKDISDEELLFLVMAVVDPNGLRAVLRPRSPLVLPTTPLVRMS